MPCRLAVLTPNLIYDHPESLTSVTAKPETSAKNVDTAGLVILLDTWARFSWDRGRPARLKNCGPAAHLRAGRPRSQGALSQDEL